MVGVIVTILEILVLPMLFGAYALHGSRTLRADPLL
jgi:hypothetical protein